MNEHVFFTAGLVYLHVEEAISQTLRVLEDVSFSMSAPSSQDSVGLRGCDVYALLKACRHLKKLELMNAPCNDVRFNSFAYVTKLSGSFYVYVCLSVRLSRLLLQQYSPQPRDQIMAG
jgi:hypothetical protein